MLLIDYIRGQKNPVQYLRKQMEGANPNKVVSRETARYWVRQAKLGVKIKILVNRGKPYNIGREVTYWSSDSD